MSSLVEAETATAGRFPDEERPHRWNATDVLFLLFFLYYAGGALIVLVHGIGAEWAHASRSLHDRLEFAVLPYGLVGRAKLRMAGASHTIESLAQFAFDYAFSILNFGLAIFLLWLRPRDWTARLLAVALVGAAGAFNLAGQYTVEFLPLVGYENVLQTSSHIIAGVSYVYALLLFPDGRPVPRLRLPWIVALYTPITAAAVFVGLRAEGTARPATLLVFHGLVTPIVGVLGQAYRFRRARTATEHAQARLLIWALLPALAVGAYFIATQGFASVTAPALAGRHLPEQPVQVFRIFQPVFLLIPFALFLGLMRYRLWDIDRVINRAVVYGTLTATLGGAYLGIVVVLQRLFVPLTGSSDFAVAVSTLAVAAAFIPARRRVQDFVDRRFYRQHYDAQRTIEEFSQRLRNELDLESLTSELRSAIAESVQPSTVTLLLKGDSGGLAWQWTFRPRGRS